MKKSFDKFLQDKLRKQDESGLLRSLTETSNLVDFSSNDYLGLGRSQAVSRLATEIHASYGSGNGSTGSRLLTGNSKLALETEDLLSKIFKCESGLFLNSGYAANLAVLSSLPGKNDTILYDEFAHASIKDGARLSQAKRFSFRHNDLADLENKLRKSAGRTFVAIESVYSMDGDKSPLKEIVSLLRSYDSVLILDEAHSTGMYTLDGAGLAVREGIESNIDVRIYTFGKAVGAHGAFVAGSRRLRDFLINFARPFIYTTAPAPHTVATVNASFRYIGQTPELQENLAKNIETYRDVMNDMDSYGANDTAIQTIRVSGNKDARELAALLQKNRLDVRPILSPTVPVGKERLRICIHSFNTVQEIYRLADHVRPVVEKKVEQ